MAKDIMFSCDLRKKIQKGVEIVNNSVRFTLGPKGRNVIISQSYGAPLIVNDGVTIAKSIELKDQFEELGAKSLIEASIKTNDLVGDGTTSAIIVGAKLIKDGIDKINKGINPVEIRKGLNYYLKEIVNEIKKASSPVTTNEDIYKVAYISSQDELVSKLITDAYEKIGKSGVITLEESQGVETTLSVVDGYSYDRGYLSSYMANESGIAELINPYVLILDKKVTSMNELVPFLEVAIKDARPLLLICSELEQEVLSALVINKVRGIINVVATSSPAFGTKRTKILSDIALLTDATFIGSGLNEIPNLENNKLGTAKKIIISNSETIIISDINSNEIKSRVKELNEEVKNTKSDYEKEQLEQRISKLSGGIGIIKVGALTELEVKEKKLRIEDAICSTKAAISEGIIEGGGKVFFEISEKLNNDFEEYSVAKELLVNALKEPFYQLLENAGANKDEILSKVNKNMWYDASTDQVVEYKNAGIIDPTMVAISVITNAISIASILLTTECGIVDIKENIKEEKIEDDLL